MLGCVLRVALPSKTLIYCATIRVFAFYDSSQLCSIDRTYLSSVAVWSWFGEYFINNTITTVNPPFQKR